MRKAYFINEPKKTDSIYNKGAELPLRILYPEEVLAMIKVWENMGKSSKDDLTNLKMLLMLGCRYEEAIWIQQHQSCFDKIGRNVEISTKKVKVVHKKRNIRLSNYAMSEIGHFFTVDKYLPNAHTFDKKLKRLAILAGLDRGDLGISVKMLRKTYESWLFYYYKGCDMHILTSQGHTKTVALEHYVGIPFNEDDKKLMREFVEGWI